MSLLHLNLGCSEETETDNGKGVKDLLVSPPVLDGLFDHGGDEDDDERRDCGGGAEGREVGVGEADGDEEVDVGDPAELLEQGLGQEGDDVVLGRGDGVAAVLLRQGRAAGVDHPREARPSDPGARVVVGNAGPPTAREAVELAEAHGPPAASPPSPVGVAVAVTAAVGHLSLSVSVSLELGREMKQQEEGNEAARRRWKQSTIQERS